jgi:hypothetical protein
MVEIIDEEEDIDLDELQVRKLGDENESSKDSSS